MQLYFLIYYQKVVWIFWNTHVRFSTILEYSLYTFNHCIFCKILIWRNFVPTKSVMFSLTKIVPYDPKKNENQRFFRKRLYDDCFQYFFKTQRHLFHMKIMSIERGQISCRPVLLKANLDFEFCRRKWKVSRRAAAL